MGKEEGMRNRSGPSSVRTVQDEDYGGYITPEGRGDNTEPLIDLFSVGSRHWSLGLNGYEMNEEFLMGMANISSSVISYLFTLIKPTTYL